MKYGLKIILPFAFLFSVALLNAQEYVTGLGLNEQVSKMSERIAVKDVKKCGCKGKKEKFSLQLPFFDDFTTTKIYPDNKKWVDYDVYVNQGFPFRSVNHGVATFDVLNYKGEIYQDANWVTFIADNLTSLPIRTDSVFSPVAKKLGVEDSLYLSFFYQPQGRGDEPELWDSLVLQFAYRTGDTVFDFMDSIEVSVDYYLDYYNTDTIFPGDTLWAPPGCDTTVYTISYVILTENDWVTVPCDSVMKPEIKWKSVWKSEGMKLQDFQKKYKTNFKQVLVPLDTTLFFYDEFQFRFLNYASIANDIIPGWKSNCDQWNIDYVYLNYGRSKSDTTYESVGFTDQPPSFIENYRIMPYKQYVSDAFNSIAKQFKVYYSNLDSIDHTVKYSYKVERRDGNGGYVYDELNPFSLQPYYNYDFRDTLEPWQNDTMSCAYNCNVMPVNQYFDIEYNMDSLSYCITHYLNVIGNNGLQMKDSIKYNQGFYNYYAYDDGIPELGYGVEPAGAECAYKFSLNTPDTIQAVQIYFNRTLGNANDVYFTLRIWRDNNGKPGQVIYEDENAKVGWNDNVIYGFKYYELTEPVLVHGTFYVGWKQNQNGSLNVGFDANTDEQNKIFYTLNNDWYQSGYHGALMIRPVVGYKGFTGEKELGQNNETFMVYPNPACKTFKFDYKLLSSDKDDKLIIYNMLGVQVYNSPLINNVVDISNLPEGLYIIRIEKTGRNLVSRLLINR